MKPVNLAFFLICLLGLIANCGQVSNSYNQDGLACGEGYDKNGAFFVVNGPDGQRMSREDLMITDLDGNNLKIPTVSRNGCLQNLDSGRYLLKSIKDDWAMVVAESPRSKTIELLDYTGQTLSIQCSESERWAVGKDFALQNTVNSSLDPKLHDAFLISYELKKPDSVIVEQKTLSLGLAANSFPFSDLTDEGHYELSVKINNFLKEGHETEKRCQLQLDRSPPKVNFSVNSNRNFQATNIQQTNSIAIVDVNENIEFVSNESDIKEVRFCLKQLDDNFTPNDTVKLIEWKKHSQDKTCTSLNTNSIRSGTPLPIESRSGIWSLRYQAVDELGNISLPASNLFIFISKDKLDLIKNLAVSDTPLFILQNKSSQAAAAALRAESLRLNLTTKYEKDLIKDYTRAGLISAFDQPGIALRVDPTDVRVQSVAITSDGKQVLAGSRHENSIRIWDLNKRTMVRSIETKGSPFALALSQDQRTIYAGLSSGILETINQESGQSKLTTAHDDTINSLVLSYDGNLLASASDDGKIKVWNAENLDLIWTFEGHSKRVTKLAIARDDLRLFSASADGQILVWDLKKGEKIQSVNSELSEIEALALSHDGSMIAVGYAREIKVYKVNSGFAKKFNLDTKIVGMVSDLAFTPDDKSLISGSSVSTIQFWNMEWGNEERKMVDTGSLISCIGVTPDGKRIVMGSSNSSLTIWEIKTGFSPEKVIAEDDKETIGSLVLSKDESFFVSLPLYSNYVNVHALTTLDSPSSKLESTAKYLTAVAISAENKIAAGTDEGEIVIWDSLKSAPDRKFVGHTKAIKSVLFNENGSHLLTGSDDNTILIRNSSTGAVVEILELQAPITALASSASGTFVSVQKTGEIDIWDFTTYKHLKSFKDPVGNLISVDITDDGSRIVTGSSNGIVRFWDVNTGISIRQPSNYPEKINSVHWLPSGQAALSGSFDQTLRIWDAATGRNISTWLGHWKGVGDIALSKNSDLAVVGAAYYNDAINVWNLSQDYISRMLCAAGNTEEFAACKNFENL